MWCGSRGSPDLDDEGAPRARALAHEVVVHAGGDEEGGDGGVVGVDAAVREHEQRVPVGDGGAAA